MVSSRTLVLFMLDAWGGRIEGKTKLQKLLYFYEQLTGSAGQLGYAPDYYGPYSGCVEQALGELRALGLLETSTLRTGRLDGRGFEIVRYDYTLTEAGRQLAESKRGSLPRTWRSLQQAVQTLKRSGDMDYMKLSCAAKSHLLLGERGGRASVEDIRELARDFGWNVTDEDVAEAFRYLEGIGLVEQGAAP
jgi:uncharacterized protein YwgA